MVANFFIMRKYCSCCLIKGIKWSLENFTHIPCHLKKMSQLFFLFFFLLVKLLAWNLPDKLMYPFHSFFASSTKQVRFPCCFCLKTTTGLWINNHNNKSEILRHAGHWRYTLVYNVNCLLWSNNGKKKWHDENKMLTM